MRRNAAPILCLASACLAVIAVAGCGDSGSAGPARHQSHSAAAGRDSATSHGPHSLSASGGSGTAALADGLYTDAPDGTPHYIIALGLGRTDDISGSVTFLYQDGRTATIGRYTGKLASGGKLSMIFADGKALAGTYAAGRLTLTRCSTVLTWAVKTIGCSFTYHGHVP